MDKKETLAQAIVAALLSHPEAGEKLQRDRESLELVAISLIARIGDPLLSCMLGLKGGAYVLHKNGDGPDDVWTVGRHNSTEGSTPSEMPLQEAIKIILAEQGAKPCDVPAPPRQPASSQPDTLDQVMKFHIAFGHPVRDFPFLADGVLNKFRADFIEEEMTEMRDALGIPTTRWQRIKAWFGWIKPKNPVEVFDALCDLQYIIDGAFLCLGFWRWKRAGVSEVHRSNMSKLGSDGKPITRADGKILKGPNYSKPDLNRVLLNPPRPA